MNAASIWGGIFLFSASPVMLWGQSSAQALAEREIQRRVVAVEEANVLLEEASTFEKAGESELAFPLYERVLESVPPAPQTSAVRARAKVGLVRTGLKVARHEANLGKRDEAEARAQKMLLPDYADGDAKVKAFLKDLQDPKKFSLVTTEETVARKQEVERLLRMADAAVKASLYDEADGYYEMALRYDPHNQAARRGMELVEKRRSQYLGAARQQTRTTMLREVTEKWEKDLPPLDLQSSAVDAMPADAPISGRIAYQLNQIVFPEVMFEQASLREVLDFLSERSKSLDTTTSESQRGVNLTVGPGVNPDEIKVSLQAQNLPLNEILRYLTSNHNLAYRVDPFAVVITTPQYGQDTLVTRQFRVPSDFIATQNLPEQDNADPFGGGNQATMGGIAIKRLAAREFLEQRGISFPEGASANYIASNSILVVRNTIPNLNLIESMVNEATGKIAKQVVVTVRMLEVKDTKLNELGFDWLMGAANHPGSNRLFFSGGVEGGNVGMVSPDHFPMSPGGVPVGANPITAGLRTAADLNSSNSSISKLLQGAQTDVNTRSPGIFSLAGVFTDPQFQMVIRALNQNGSVDMVTAPEVVAKSGQRANIKVIREFPYPTEFDPPQLPQTVTSNIYIDPITGQASGGNQGSVPVTPTTPTTFEVKEVGVTLDVEAQISDDGRMIDLQLNPKTTIFEGFINYGAPISVGAGSGVAEVDNMIIQPIFRNNSVNTSVTIYDGETVVLGGVIGQNMQTIDDKVPILGDLPWLGRLFQSKVELKETTNVIFFVTAKVIDPSGNVVRPKNQNKPEAPPLLDRRRGTAATPEVDPLMFLK